MRVNSENRNFFLCNNDLDIFFREFFEPNTP
jgi:hypothetical protein